MSLEHRACRRYASEIGQGHTGKMRQGVARLWHGVVRVRSVGIGPENDEVVRSVFRGPSLNNLLGDLFGHSAAVLVPLRTAAW